MPNEPFGVVICGLHLRLKLPKYGLTCTLYKICQPFHNLSHTGFTWGLNCGLGDALFKYVLKTYYKITLPAHPNHNSFGSLGCVYVKCMDMCFECQLPTHGSIHLTYTSKYVSIIFVAVHVL